MSKNNGKLCAYCKKKVKLEELLQVDSIVKTHDSEVLEFIWDELPEISHEDRKNPKFSHLGKWKYEILNVCMDCYQKAYKQYNES